MVKTTAANVYYLVYNPSPLRKCSTPFTHFNCTLKSRLMFIMENKP